MTKSNEISVTSKKFQENDDKQVVVVELGLKLEQDNQDRSFVCKTRLLGDDHHDHGKNCGPTYNGYYNNIINYNNNNNTPKNLILYSSNSSSSNVDNCTTTTNIATPTTTSVTTAVSSGGYVRGLHHFDVSSSYYSPPNNPFFKSSGGMATATMGYPFTAAQWKELERQAMIYKYMMASLPVPPDLLYSSFPSSTFAPTSYYLGKYGSGISMRWSGNSKDAEPGRCRRTDGKKWRCSRDVAPNQKYCERHMHRGRPRSRKHVEQQLQLQQQHQHSLSNLSFNTNTTNDKNNDNIAPVPTTKKTRLSDASSNPQCVGSSVAQSCSKASSIFDHALVSGGNSNPFEDSRNLAWNDEQQWSHLVQQANMNSTVFQNQFEGEHLNLNSHAVFNSKSDEMGVLERPLIDAWSMGMSGNKNHGGHGNNVTLSLNGGNRNANPIDEEMCQIHMGIGLIDSWVSSTPTPGGPLAEVLMPGNPAMSDAGESEFVTPPATTVSSPSGVLQKTFATFSDSSGSNSPTTCNNSKASSEMPFHWLN